MAVTRHTPRLDALLARLDTALQEHGAKADLARVLQSEAGISFQAAKNRLSRILGRAMLPNGEDTLLFQEWLGGRPRKAR
jgi:hypothetical protein